MGGFRATWRSDREFIRLARKHWPLDLRLADNNGQSAKFSNAITKMTRRYEGYLAAKETA